MSRECEAVKKIVIFDSGVGGLSVYQEVHKRLPGCQYIYCFDNAAFPYGELDSEVLIQRCSYFVTHLVERFDADLVVIACNTASTVVLPTLRKMLSVPVVGVVPAIKPAARLSQKKVIGLLATPATVQRSYTKKLVDRYANDCQVLMLGSTRLVEMGEEKMRGKAVDLIELQDILHPWFGLIDCVVLGCTHFPLIKDEISRAFNHKITVIDSGKAVASRVVDLMKDDLRNEYQETDENRNLAFCSAVPYERTALDLGLKKIKLSFTQELSFL